MNFYDAWNLSMAETSQDAYLALTMKEAAMTGKPVRAETQPWAR
jgi:hypothetical protein